VRANIGHHVVYIGGKITSLKVKRDFLQGHRMSVWARARLFHVISPARLGFPNLEPDPCSTVWNVRCYDFNLEPTIINYNVDWHPIW